MNEYIYFKGFLIPKIFSRKGKQFHRSVADIRKDKTKITLALRKKINLKFKSYVI